MLSGGLTVRSARHIRRAREDYKAYGKDALAGSTGIRAKEAEERPMNFAWDPKTLGNDRRSRPVHGERRPMNFAWDENDPAVAMFAGAKAVGRPARSPRANAKIDSDVFNQRGQLVQRMPASRPAAPEWWPNDQGVGEPRHFEMETSRMEECDIDAQAAPDMADEPEDRTREVSLAEDFAAGGGDGVSSVGGECGSGVVADDSADKHSAVQSGSSFEDAADCTDGADGPGDPFALGEEVVPPVTPMRAADSLVEPAPLEGETPPEEQTPRDVPREDDVDAAVKAVDRALERVRRRKSQDRERKRTAMAEQKNRQSTAQRMRERRKSTPKPWRSSPYKPSNSKRKDASPAGESPLTRNKIYVDAPSAHDRSRRSTTYSQSFSYGW